MAATGQPGRGGASIHQLLTDLRGVSAIGDIHEAGQVVDLIGYVHSHTQTKPTRKGEFNRAVIVCDPTAANATAAIMIQIYRREMVDIPAVENGSIVIFRNFKTFQYGDGLQAWSSAYSSWTVFDTTGRRLLFSSPNARHLVVPEEQMSYIARLADWRYARDGLPRPAPPVASNGTSDMQSAQSGSHGGAPVVVSIQAKSTGRSLVMIKDMETMKFYDLFCVVIKTFPSRDDCFTLYVTDFTTNELLVEYGDHGALGSSGGGKWQGPIGKLVLQVSLWGASAHWAMRHVTEGKYVRLTNLRTKLNPSGYLEGTCDSDRRFPEKVLCAVVDNDVEAVRSIRQRRQAYLYSHEARIADREQERRAEERQKRLAAIPQPTGVNPNVQCSYAQVPATPIGDIVVPDGGLDTGGGVGGNNRPASSGRRYRTFGRIVDFWPTDLRDFARPWCRACQATFEPVWLEEELEPEDDFGLSQFPVTARAPGDAQQHDSLAEKQRHQRRLLQCRICKAIVGRGSHTDPDAFPDADAPEDVVWEFAFATLVEGQDCVPLPVIWSGAELDVLLGCNTDTFPSNGVGVGPQRKIDLRPCNLHDPDNAPVLECLRERLFRLWGDLEERLSPAPHGSGDSTGATAAGTVAGQGADGQGLWVEMCVMEYNLPALAGVAGWRGRRFKGFGVRIL